MENKLKFGYIDEDEHQVRKYKRRFREFGIEIIGYDFFEGMTLHQLMEQVYNSDIDLLLIDYKLDESNKVFFNGEEVEKEIYDKRPLFPCIIFTNKRDDAENYVEDLKIIFSKDEIPSKEDEEYDRNRTERFIKILISSVVRYKGRIDNRKNRISEILKKGEEKGLNIVDEDNLIKLQRELGDLDKTKRNEVPEKLISSEKLEDLSETRKKAEDFLKSLIKKNKEK
ncbi:hypothetical protein POV27_09315 [Aureisphaera galaxeae]|uniref:hypothetical protein n=1 Tax=Aureisphaera galaxeae TaxID=1538023 RepID=UPI002350D841|nr:hypothetical protein [Aureisphaera galaxeae]MDC8004249.1 hypothetical protein [Aureisphaera galaxeae]